MFQPNWKFHFCSGWLCKAFGLVLVMVFVTISSFWQLARFPCEKPECCCSCRVSTDYDANRNCVNCAAYLLLHIVHKYSFSFYSHRMFLLTLGALSTSSTHLHTEKLFLTFCVRKILFILISILCKNVPKNSYFIIFRLNIFVFSLCISLCSVWVSYCFFLLSAFLPFSRWKDKKWCWRFIYFRNMNIQKKGRKSRSVAAWQKCCTAAAIVIPLLCR